MGSGTSRIRTDKPRDKARDLIEGDLQSRKMTDAERDQLVEAIVGPGSDASVDDLEADPRAAVELIDTRLAEGKKLTSADAKIIALALDAPYATKSTSTCPGRSGQAASLTKMRYDPESMKKAKNAKGSSASSSSASSSSASSSSASSSSGATSPDVVGETGDGSGIPDMSSSKFHQQNDACYNCDCTRANCPECSACNFHATGSPLAGGVGSRQAGGGVSL
jgi:hypothetical protein